MEKTPGSSGKAAGDGMVLELRVFLRFIYFRLMCLSVLFASTYAHACCTSRGQKRALESQKLELGDLRGSMGAGQ